ncbi:MAG: TrkA family potassium uptake protein [Clostridia bacterium]
MIKKTYAILGLGRFGSTLARTLYSLGNEVMAVDKDPEAVRMIMDDVNQALEADTTDEHVLSKIGIRNFDCVIVSIGHDIRASILTTVQCKELGVKMLIAKASDELHAKLLEKTGADKVVQPEKDGGERLARQLISQNVIDFLELSDEYSIKEMHVPLSWVGQSLLELDVRKKYNVSIIAIRRGAHIILAIDVAMIFQTGDVIITIGRNTDLSLIENLASGIK